MMSDDITLRFTKKTLTTTLRLSSRSLHGRHDRLADASVLARGDCKVPPSSLPAVRDLRP
jgi:hypothetical protein